MTLGSALRPPDTGESRPALNRVCVVGSLNYDLSARAERLPTPGETVLGGDFRRGPGGKGINQAVAARRAGARVAFVGRVGDDDFGRAFRTALHGEGIDDLHLSIDPAEPTGVGLIALSERGENQILVAPGANMALGPGHVTDDALRGADVLVLQCEVPAEVNRAAAERARAFGGRVIFNAAPACPWARGFLPLSDVLVVNEVEAAALSGRRDPARAAEVLGGLVPAVVVTLGEHGLVACIGGAPEHQQAFGVRAVDTVGAGDAFTGILAAFWGRVPDSRALRIAQAGASVCVERAGAIASMPAWAAISHRMAEAPA